MTALVITLGFVAFLAIAMMVPSAFWAGAPDQRGEVRHLEVARPATDDDPGDERLIA